MSKRRQLNKATKAIGAFITLVIMVFVALVTDQIPDLLARFEDERSPGYHRVEKVSDGDTIVVSVNGTKERVRLIGVDTPEKNHPEKPVQCFAEAATRFTTDRIGNQRVRLEADPTNDNRDRYDRLLRYVYFDDGSLLNAEIIKEGYGFAYVSFPFQKQSEFLAHEASARENNKGLWSDCEIDASDYSLETNPAN